MKIIFLLVGALLSFNLFAVQATVDGLNGKLLLNVDTGKKVIVGGDLQVEGAIMGSRACCCGHTKAGARWTTVDGWGDPLKAAYGAWYHVAAIKVDASGCKFQKTPKYFTSLGGGIAGCRSHGSTAILEPSEDGFKLRVSFLSGVITWFNESPHYGNCKTCATDYDGTTTSLCSPCPNANGFAKHYSMSINWCGCGELGDPDEEDTGSY